MEIRRSPGRFLSIFLIVAIGVAFFSGIRATEPDMRYTADAYSDKYQLMDLQVISTLGPVSYTHLLMALVISGGLAGLAGYVQYAGVSHRIMEQMPNNAGYTGIVIAYLSRLNPLVIVIVSVLFAGLQNSSATVQVMGCLLYTSRCV